MRESAKLKKYNKWPKSSCNFTEKPYLLLRLIGGNRSVVEHPASVRDQGWDLEFDFNQKY
jgi:hypothetical protein